MEYSRRYPIVGFFELNRHLLKDVIRLYWMYEIPEPALKIRCVIGYSLLQCFFLIQPFAEYRREMTKELFGQDGEYYYDVRIRESN